MKGAGAGTAAGSGEGVAADTAPSAAVSAVRGRGFRPAEGAVDEGQMGRQVLYRRDLGIRFRQELARQRRGLPLLLFGDAADRLARSPQRIGADREAQRLPHEVRSPLERGDLRTGAADQLRHQGRVLTTADSQPFVRGHTAAAAVVAHVLSAHHHPVPHRALDRPGAPVGAMHRMATAHRTGQSVRRPIRTRFHQHFASRAQYRADAALNDVQVFSFFGARGKQVVPQDLGGRRHDLISPGQPSLFIKPQLADFALREYPVHSSPDSGLP